MSKLLEHISLVEGKLVAVESGDKSLTYIELKELVCEVKLWLSKKQVSSVALVAQNSIDWIVVDLACQSLGLLLTPIPLFFTTEQFNQVLKSVKPDLIMSDVKLPMDLTFKCAPLNLSGCWLNQTGAINVPKGTSKVTYTSGSTGNPKGVCLSEDNQWCVAKSLVDVIGLEKPRHLCLLPLPTLLENIAGIYAPLLTSGTVIVPNDESRGFSGSKLIAPEKILNCISTNKPTTLILVPELLQVLVSACNKGWQPPDSLRFVAVGGSKVAQKLIVQAKSLGLPVCQGYGLSECASVVSLCSLDNDAADCGKVLPHLTVKTIDSEVVVMGNTFLGYLEQPETWGSTQVRTGDIGNVIAGRLIIEGRLNNTLINSFGRNISPEWVESELLATGAFMQAVVIGDAKPFCSALLVPINAHMTTSKLYDLVDKVNQSLPDYAQVQSPIILSAPMTVEQGLYTENMRPKRELIHQFFESEIAQVYAETCERE